MVRAFRQVDVFATQPGTGNPLAVVHDADGLTDAQMARFAAWTNLSETTFLCAPSTATADYRVRIFTTGGELPFAGHPTLGSAHAWLEAGGVPNAEDIVIQECGVGLVPVQRGERLAFAAPPLLRSGSVSAQDVDRFTRALRIPATTIRATAWIDNGPGWIGVDVGDAEAVLAIRPDVAAFSGLKLAVVGLHPEGTATALGAAVEVRAFYDDGDSFDEDPVTGSANAGLAQWLIGSGRLPSTYTARQGTALARDGRIHVRAVGDQVWVGGEVRTLIRGEVEL